MRRAQVFERSPGSFVVRESLSSSAPLLSEIALLAPKRCTNCGGPHQPSIACAPFRQDTVLMSPDVYADIVRASKAP